MSAHDDKEAGAASLGGGHHQQDIPRPIAEDAMFTVRRTEGAVRGQGGTEPTVQEINALRCLAIEYQFMREGWPPFDALVAVSQTDYYAWDAMPDDWRDALAAEGVHPQAEVVGIFERGLHFIRRRIEPLTPDYWLVEEAHLIRRALNAPETNAALQAGHELGVLRARGHHHGLHLGSVTQVRTRDLRLREAGAIGTENLRKGAELWRQRALELARDLRLRRPELSASAAAKYIARSLAGDGYISGQGTPPSVRSVRRAIAPLWAAA